MSTKNINVNLREGSIIQQIFNDLKDGKVHKLSALRTKYKKLGVKKPRYAVYRLCRILRTVGTPYQINSSDRTDSVQMVLRDKAAAARAALKSKSTSTKTSKPKNTKSSTKTVKAKATPVAVIEDDDDVLEN